MRVLIYKIDQRLHLIPKNDAQMCYNQYSRKFPLFSVLFLCLEPKYFLTSSKNIVKKYKQFYMYIFSLILITFTFGIWFAISSQYLNLHLIITLLNDLQAGIYWREKPGPGILRHGISRISLRSRNLFPTPKMLLVSVLVFFNFPKFCHSLLFMQSVNFSDFD